MGDMLRSSIEIAEFQHRRKRPVLATVNNTQSYYQNQLNKSLDLGQGQLGEIISKKQRQ